MKKVVTIAFAGLILLSELAVAEDQTIKLSVPNMSCASCPYIVEGSINKLDGIKSVDATMKDRTATVVFDDAVTTAESIMEATANVGYQATLITEEDS